MTIQINDRMYLNEPASLKHGSLGTITNVKTRGEYRYELTLDGDEFGYWYPETMLSVTPPQKTPSAMPETCHEPIEISSGLGIGGFGSDDYSITSEMQPMPEYSREKHRPGSQVCPAGTTYGTRGDDNDFCWCGKPGDWNSGAGQILCERHWDEY